MEEVTIKSIFMINEDFYENVKFKGTYKNFVDMVLENYKFIKIYESDKEIYLNTDCIMSFELGDDWLFRKKEYYRKRRLNQKKI